ncbi:DUF4232 domain-containing protein [Streptomyces violaceusniger]|uniref:Glycine-rich secreted protein n=1 Tax=Streptomyces violaceusniger (strain Tu 4113) TaxID=653045 RepID=G2NZT6_STRV4|nr:DUF4232 domain-containing protein [Streptomyces violaceusniger]AEM80172.1 glycine-rich secreted protein [Streptomyces violaceusniger Tu 4113]
MSSNTTARTTRRRTLRIAAATLTAAAALTLTACNGSDANASKPAAGAEAKGGSSSAGAQGSGAKADPAAEADTKAGAAGKQSSGSHAADGDRAGSGVQRCHTSGLEASFATGGDAAPDPNAGGSTTTSIVLTNAGDRPCKIGGFAGVDLTSENGGQVWSLARSSAKYGSITLGPGDSTDFTINLAMTDESEEGSYKPAFAVVTPPNETSSLKLEWPWGALVDQRAATHPATFVNPIG